MNRIHIARLLACLVVTSMGCGGVTPSPTSPTAATPPATSASCTATLAPATQNVPVSGGAFFTKVTSACPWNASTTDGWISITYGQGAGIGSVTYDVSANPAATARTGELRIGEQVLRITQVAPDCSVSTQPGSRQVPDTGGAFDITLTTPHQACPWSASVSVPWVTLNATDGIGSGTIRVTISANTAFESRHTSITVGERTIAVVQAAAEEPPAPPTPPTVPPPPAPSPGPSPQPAPNPSPQPQPPPQSCSYSLDPESFRFAASADSGSFSVKTGSGCQWTAAASEKWIAVKPASGTGGSRVTFAIDANPGAFRQGRITIGGTSVVVSQDAAPVTCPISVEPASRTVGVGGTQAMEFAVTAGTNCSWKADPTASWIRILRGSGIGNGGGVFAVDPNRGPTRSARIWIGQRAIDITQYGYDVIGTFTGVK